MSAELFIDYSNHCYTLAKGILISIRPLQRSELHITEPITIYTVSVMYLWF